MKIRYYAVGLIASALLALLLGGCATYYPASSDRGVYFETPQYRSARVMYIDPLVYPYWSLDYFYYSRFYHPYSVVVHRYDPWYYPYPGWYYGYWPGPRFAASYGRFHVPWYRYPDRYDTYHPWRADTRVSFGYTSRGRYDRREEPRERIRDISTRLRDVESRRAMSDYDQRPDHRFLPGAAPRFPATGRGAATVRGDRRAHLPEQRERQRSADPSPPRNQPQRRPTRESTRPSRTTPRQRRDPSVHSDRRERRERR